MKEGGADWLHLDVMDGHFVPNLTIGPGVVQAIRKVSDMHLDCHLMISDPHTYAPRFLEAGADTITVHAEVRGDLPGLLRTIRAGGAKAGLALKPATPAEVAIELLDELDMVLVMTVEPGFGGQSYMADMEPKLEALVAARGERALDLQVDGGLNPETVVRAARAGANVIVAGSAVFKAEDPAQAIRALREGAERGRAAG